MFSIDDIQIFITTHNRATYVQASIESLLSQTAGVKKIVVLDNESTDDTESVVARYADRGVVYVKTNGWLGNFNTAKKLANQPYVMLFHDDDLLHPQYLELALTALNQYKNTSLIATRYVEFEDASSPQLTGLSVSKKAQYFQTQKAFANFMYFQERICYASAIYRTDAFLNTSLEYERFSKFNDWPFMVKLAGHGTSILFEDPQLMWVRRHPLQDTWTRTNSPSLEQIVNWDAFFYDVLQITPANPILYKTFMVKMLQFSMGKYEDFLSEESKKRLTSKALLQTILNSSMEVDSSILLEALRHSSLVNVVRQKPLHWRERLKEIIRRPRSLFSR